MGINEMFKIMSVTLDINDFCNMKCSYCWEQKGKNRLTMENASIICDRLIDNFKTNKPASNIRVHFFGGEPLLDWDLIKFIIEKISVEMPAWFGITTNASIIDDSMIEYFVEKNIGVMVSIDGTKETHDSKRRFLDGTGTYDIVSENLKKILDAGVDCEARMTVTPKDAKHLYDDILHLVEMGAKHIAPCPVYDQEWSDEDLEHFKNAMIKTYDLYIQKHFDQESKIYIKFFEDYLFKDISLNHKSVPCGFGTNTTVTIDAAGNIYPCHQVPTRADKEKFILGNFITGEVYDNENVKPVKPGDFYSEKCIDCEAYNTICGGGCLMESYEENKDLLCPTNTTCLFYRLYHKTISEIQNEGIPSPRSPSERRDFLHSSVTRILKNIRDIIEENKGKEMETETIAKISEAMWMVNEQVLNNKSIHFNTIDIMSEIKDVSDLIRAEVK